MSRLIKSIVFSMSIGLIGLGAITARAEPVLERIARTGVFNAGTRGDTLPFAYRNKKGELVGISVDLLDRLYRRLEQHFGHPLKLELHEVTPANRIELVESGAIDIECGTTTPTWEREARVDFSIPFFLNRTRIMTLENTANKLQDLQGKRIGVITGSTTIDILAEHVPGVIMVEIPNMASGFAQFNKRELDGLANIGILLRAMVEGHPVKSKVVLLPQSGFFAYEGMACMLPQNDSAWRDFVNRTFAELLNGIDEYRGGYMEIYERWFGPRGVVYFPIDQATVRHLAASLIWLR